MKSIQKTLFVVSAIITSLVLVPGRGQGQDAPQIWQAELCAVLNEMESGQFLYDTNSTWKELEDLCLRNTKGALFSLVEAFIRKNRNMELLWWKSHNRAACCFILALFYCSTDEFTSAAPEYELSIKRFNVQEQQERGEELAFVLEYRAALAKKIANILKKRDPVNYKTDYRDTFGYMGLWWFRKPLPRWCRKASVHEVHSPTEFQSETTTDSSQ